MKVDPMRPGALPGRTTRRQQPGSRDADEASGKFTP
jgi:hypothetical protein